LASNQLRGKKNKAGGVWVNQSEKKTHTKSQPRVGELADDSVCVAWPKPGFSSKAQKKWNRTKNSKTITGEKKEEGEVPFLTTGRKKTGV